MKADLVLHNGTVITMEGKQHNALAIAGERIAWVGDKPESWIGPKTQVIDLKGAYVYPGFIDSHLHILLTGIFNGMLNLKNTRSKSEVVEKVKAEIKKIQPGEWLTGSGWEEDGWTEKKHPTAADLDAVAPNNPVVLIRADTHSIWVNSAALKLAGIDHSTPDPDGGKIYRDKKGHPTGMLLDKAMYIVYNVFPKPDLEETIKITKHVLDEFLKIGITMVHNASTPLGELEAFQELAKRGELNVRIYGMGVIPGECGEMLLKEGPQSYGPFLEMHCLKFFMDGALGSRGAAVLEQYEDDPGNRGLLFWSEEDLLPILKEAKKKNLQVAFHAIGDAANRRVIEAYEMTGVKGKRWRIEHAQLLDTEDVKRMVPQGIIAAMQPLHLIADMGWMEQRIGKTRVKGCAFCWRSLLDAGVKVAGGSDSPVVDPNPLLGMYAAITRKNLDGTPEGGWHPEQCVTQEEALRMYTLDAAYAAFKEKDLGSIKVGKLADLVVLPENLLTCAPAALLDMPVLYTIVNGKVVYSS